MGLLALTDWVDSAVSVAVMVIASVITVSYNGLAFTAIAHRAAALRRPDRRCGLPRRVCRVRIVPAARDAPHSCR
jgi:hypothetical protein